MQVLFADYFDADGKKLPESFFQALVPLNIYYAILLNAAETDSRVPFLKSFPLKLQNHT